MTRYSVVDDVGRMINPMLVKGQIHGGIAQGLGQGLFEHLVYDSATAQPVTGSFMDYTMPRADDMASDHRRLLVTALGLAHLGEDSQHQRPPAPPAPRVAPGPLT